MTNKNDRAHLRQNLLFTLLLISIPAKCYCSDFSSKAVQIDTVVQKKQNSSLRVLKYNPIQLVLSEIPISLEVFKGEKKSIQCQIGILIPFSSKYSSSFFSPPSSNMISCRTMPWFSYGVSAKFEFRTYRKKEYYAIQGMYKYAAYNNVSFTIWDSNPIYESYDQIESKSSHILGIGYIVGRQTYDDNSVTDKYFGVGLRLRIMNGIIEAEKFGAPAGRIEAHKPFHYSTLYPFLNLGLRFGKAFYKNKNSSLKN